MIAVGIIDTFGFVGSVEALDTCLKTAEVEFVKAEKMSGGIVSLVIQGDVAAVSASIAAGVEAAKLVGGYRNHTVIARLDDQTEEMLKTEKRLNENPDNAKEQNIDEALLEGVEESEEERCFHTDTVFGHNENKADKSWNYSEEELNMMTVSNLRKLAREMNLKGMSKEKIKRSRKFDLISTILSELKREEE